MNGEEQYLESPRYNLRYRECIVDNALENSWDYIVEIVVARVRQILNLEPEL